MPVYLDGHLGFERALVNRHATRHNTADNGRTNGLYLVVDDRDHT